jgi:hypothetical protein
MAIVENLISEQNQYDLFYNILLSVKSKNPSFSIEREKDGKYKLKIEETNSAVKNIINVISTTVDKAHKLDNKIDEILNN